MTTTTQGLALLATELLSRGFTDTTPAGFDQHVRWFDHSEKVGRKKDWPRTRVAVDDGQVTLYEFGPFGSEEFHTTWSHVPTRKVYMILDACIAATERD